MQHYKGDISELELYFVIVNNEYGEQTEEELLPGGKNLHVTNENVITFIHLVANHRLNYQVVQLSILNLPETVWDCSLCGHNMVYVHFQIRQQSSHFLRGFQQLVQKDWIDMFNEHELQVLWSTFMLCWLLFILQRIIWSYCQWSKINIIKRSQSFSALGKYGCKELLHLGLFFIFFFMATSLQIIDNR